MLHFQGGCFAFVLLSSCFLYIRQIRCSLTAVALPALLIVLLSVCAANFSFPVRSIWCSESVVENKGSRRGYYLRRDSPKESIQSTLMQWRWLTLDFRGSFVLELRLWPLCCLQISNWAARASKMKQTWMEPAHKMYSSLSH